MSELEAPSIAENHPQYADSPYGVSKLVAEKIIIAYSGIYDLEGICLRYFYIYGVNQRYGLYGYVMPVYDRRIYYSKPMVIYGDGKQTRDFVSFRDATRENNLAVILQKKTGAHNLGNSRIIETNHLAEMM